MSIFDTVKNAAETAWNWKGTDVAGLESAATTALNWQGINPKPAVSTPVTPVAPVAYGPPAPTNPLPAIPAPVTQPKANPVTPVSSVKAVTTTSGVRDSMDANRQAAQQAADAIAAAKNNKDAADMVASGVQGNGTGPKQVWNPVTQSYANAAPDTVNPDAKPKGTQVGTGILGKDIPMDPNTGVKDVTGYYQSGTDAEGNSLWTKAATKEETATAVQSASDNLATASSTALDPKVSEALDSYNTALEAYMAGGYTADEANQIQQAGEAAGAQYDEQISQAEYQKKEGIGVSTVRLGEAGGFLGSAMGAQLAGIESQYQSSTNQLKTAQATAMATAESAAKTAIRTGKAADLKILQDAYTTVRDTYDKQAALNDAHLNTMSNIQKRDTYSVAPGTTLVDSTGKVLYTAPETKTPAEKEYEFYAGQEVAAGRNPMPFSDYNSNVSAGKKPDIAEYNYAVSQGYKGDFMQYLADKRGVSASAVQLDDATLDMLADNYLTTMTLPNMGMGTAGAQMKAEVLKRAAAKSGGTNPALNKAIFGSLSQTLTAQTKTATQVKAYEKTATANLDRFTKLLKEVADTGTPILNMPARAISKELLGDPKMAAVEAARTVAFAEVAKVLSGGTGSGAVSDSGRKEAENLLSGNMTFGQALSTAELLKQDMASRTQSLDDSIQGLKDDISGMNAGGGSAGGTTGGGGSSGSSSQGGTGWDF
jgi:hypothetical protein